MILSSPTRSSAWATVPSGASSTRAGSKPKAVDVLGELEKLRQTMHQPAAAAPKAAATTNGRGEVSRTIELTLKRSDFQRARRFLVSFQVEDEQHRVMDAVRDLQVDLKDVAGLEKLLLRLNIALNTKE